MTNTHTTPGGPLTGEPITIDGQPAYRVPLTGRDGAGSFALVDPEGLERLRQAGAQALYLTSDGHGNCYVTFLRTPTHNTTTAARTIITAEARGRRVIYLNGDRHDLRTANLMVQPRKDEDDQGPTGAKARAINYSWQEQRSLRRQAEGSWKRPVPSAGDRRPW